MLRNEKLEPIYETVRLVKAGLPAETSFLGFAGSPWTVATYMVAGQGTKDHGLARRMAYADPARFGAIIDAITDLTVEYLAGQVEAGVDAVQLFDSWAGSLSPAQFKQWVRSEEHTSETPVTNAHIACRLLLEKK